ncbi:FAD-binding oxidoreductase [Bradyrhizobium sp. LHD-71]|uniref:FAD-binding oxidoreductase n=1 Tax=Bradyrhizobium sp. LHD-71 TaxID=3072141 RepID=UPI00280C83D6|nr:FAD-binding oxidoreductase [Bradyrhizobium sp. LHD-71]MDQ8728049.1 FAD-binding oxidoreductase [Bradyrhizobium sp. LHD-71]
MTGGRASRQVSAWGRLTANLHEVVRLTNAAQACERLSGGASTTLPVGVRRSYGDVCLNSGGRLLETVHLDRFIHADWQRGVVVVEAGMTIDELLRVSVPNGWFVPVTPGTKFVTLGGAVANDVHGKNHHLAGTFGRYVRRLRLARSDSEIVEVSPEQQPELFAATVGGLGLTGIIVDLELKLLQIASSYLEVETLPMANTDDFFHLSAESEKWPYTVAWVDCFATGATIGRGLYMRGRPLDDSAFDAHPRPSIAVPFTAPSVILNPLTIRSFNAFYRRMATHDGLVRVHYDKFFYPLDAVGSWNRLYGARGFYQFQCVVPMAQGGDVVRQLLQTAAEARQGSFLVVLKTFGNLPSPGILSFPHEGVTLSLDFPNKGNDTSKLLARLNAIAIDAGGRIYPAKDATMTAAQFQSSYPRWQEVERCRDAAIMSDFWRRVTGRISQ